MLLSVYKTKRDYTEMALIPQTKPETKPIAASVGIEREKKLLPGWKEKARLNQCYVL